MVYDTLVACRETSSTTEKKQLLQELFMKYPDTREFFERVFDTTRYDVSVKTIEKAAGLSAKDFDTPIHLVEHYVRNVRRPIAVVAYNVTEMLENFSGIRGNKQIKFLQEVYDSVYLDQVVLFTMIILKNTYSGVSHKIVNAALKAAKQPEIEIFSPQLAMRFDDIYNISWEKPYAVSEKYDGFRLIIEKRGDDIIMTSRQGKSITSLPEFEKQFKRYDFDFIIDGEAMADTFHDISTRISRKDEYTDISGLRYVCFDVLELKGEDVKKKPFIQRTALLRNTFIQNTLIRFEHLIMTDDDTLMQEFYQKIVNNNGEGVMIKKVDAPYEYGSRKNWAKIKPVYEATMKVIGYEQGSNKYRETIGALICESECGTISTNVGSGLTDEMREYFNGLKNSNEVVYIDVLYNEVSHDKDNMFSLRHPRFLKIREDKDTANVFEEFPGRRQ